MTRTDRLDRHHPPAARATAHGGGTGPPLRDLSPHGATRRAGALRDRCTGHRTGGLRVATPCRPTTPSRRCSLSVREVVHLLLGLEAIEGLPQVPFPQERLSLAAKLRALVPRATFPRSSAGWPSSRSTSQRATNRPPLSKTCSAMPRRAVGPRHLPVRPRPLHPPAPAAAAELPERILVLRGLCTRRRGSPHLSRRPFPRRRDSRSPGAGCPRCRCPTTTRPTPRSSSG